MYLFISALFSFSFTNTNIHLKFLITIILYIESSRGFLMWAVQSPGRRLRPLVYFWVVLSGIWNASGLHCGAMRTAHIKNPDWGGRVWLYPILQALQSLRSFNTCLQQKKNPRCGLTPNYSLREL